MGEEIDFFGRSIYDQLRLGDYQEHIDARPDLYRDIVIRTPRNTDQCYNLIRKIYNLRFRRIFHQKIEKIYRRSGCSCGFEDISCLQSTSPEMAALMFDSILTFDLESDATVTTRPIARTAEATTTAEVTTTAEATTTADAWTTDEATTTAEATTTTEATTTDEATTTSEATTTVQATTTSEATAGYAWETTTVED